MINPNAATRIIAPTEWGRDHWSTLAYAFTTLGTGGRLEHRRLRLDGDEYPTRLAGGGVEVGHTDIDCIADIEAAGVLRNVGTGANPVVVFTDEGLKLGAWLCRAMVARAIRTSNLTWAQAIEASNFAAAGVAQPQENQP